MTISNWSHEPLTIAIDTWPLLSQYRNTGMYIYTRNLVLRFREMALKDSVHVTPLISPARANDANAFEASTRFQPLKTNLFRIGRVWRYGGACLSSWINRADLLFCPSGTTLPFGSFVPVVATIHDLTPIVCPTFPKRIARGLKFAFANTARFSRSIITDSLCSKRDLMETFGLPESRVHVIYLGCDEKLFNDVPVLPPLRTSVLNKFGLHRPYIFHHGTIQPRKNLKRLIEAYRMALSRNPNLELDLVLAGDLGWQYEDILAVAQSNHSAGRIIFSGPVADENLSVLLKSASLVVIPSLYEGFCLPLLEAMACSAPTICSNSSCLPEISGGILRYFDPTSVDDLATCIEQALESAELRAELSSHGRKRAALFSWQRCAEETMEVLKSAARS